MAKKKIPVQKPQEEKVPKEAQPKTELQQRAENEMAMLQRTAEYKQMQSQKKQLCKNIRNRQKLKFDRYQLLQQPHSNIGKDGGDKKSHLNRRVHFLFQQSVNEQRNHTAEITK